MEYDFNRFDNRDVCDLIAEFPLAWVIAVDGKTDEASLLPLLGEYDADGKLTHLFGHMSRRNALFSALTEDPRALILVQGPNAYISPEQAGKLDWAPTWNFAQLRIGVTVTFVPDETGSALARLVSKMESHSEQPWKVSELGARYDPMAKAVIAFRAEVTHLQGTFKLGQDEDGETLAAILSKISDPVLWRWMRRFNPRYQA